MGFKHFAITSIMLAVRRQGAHFLFAQFLNSFNCFIELMVPLVVVVVPSL